MGSVTDQLAAFAGAAPSSTTQRYTAVDDGELRAAMTAALDDAI
jgi:hypothetical protein